MALDSKLEVSLILPISPPHKAFHLLRMPKSSAVGTQHQRRCDVRCLKDVPGAEIEIGLVTTLDVAQSS